MDYASVLTAAQALGLDDRVRLAEALWEKIEAESADTELTDELRAELRRRADAHRASPNEVVPWEVVKARALARARQ